MSPPSGAVSQLTARDGIQRASAKVEIWFVLRFVCKYNLIQVASDQQQFHLTRYSLSHLLTPELHFRVRRERQPGIIGLFSSLCEVTGIFIVSSNPATYLCTFPSPQHKSALHRGEADSTADARHLCTFICQAQVRK